MSAGLSVPAVLAPRSRAVRESELVLLARAVSRRVAIAQNSAGVIGAIDCLVLALWVLPAPPLGAPEAEVVRANLALFALALPIALGVGTFLGTRWARGTKTWLAEGREPTGAERRRALRAPAHCALVSGSLWTAGAVVAAVVNLRFSPEFALHLGTTVLMGGVTSTALAYLLAERLFRPITAAALAGDEPAGCSAPGVTGRLLLAWGAATGVPVAGLVVVGADALLYDQPRDEAAVATIVLGSMALATGLAATVLVARSLSDPLRELREALRRLEAGDPGAEVPVDDASEVGLLQAGFNRMAAGLREREALRDLFGRHVGEDVARAALTRGIVLGGELRDVGVLFVDLEGSTQLAARRPPEEVVGVLNRFFAEVVDVVGRHGGWVNKFEGDAALVLFGAPAEHEDPAGAALAAARELRDRLAIAVPSVKAGIGVSAGPCVAGNVGAEERFEYTVIGDPVNEAARLSDLAKQRPERLAAAAAALAGDPTPSGWRDGEVVQLRGRAAPTHLLLPA